MVFFAAMYIILALLGIIRSGTGKIPIFDLALPSINALCIFSLMLYVTRISEGGNTVILGSVGVVIALSHLAFSFWLAQRGGRGAPGAASYTFACGVLLALALPAATGKWTLSLPVLSLVAIFMAVMSRVWESGTVRLTTYLFHLYCCSAIIFSLKGEGAAATDPLNILPSGLLACIVLYQYQWCRWWPPTENSSFFSRFDVHDRSAAMLLLAGLTSGFYMMRITFFQAMPMFPVAIQRDAFSGSQSILINCAAIALILFAFLKQNKEIRNIAIFVMIIGGVKVFLYDLMGIHGLPLVFSVFSFGSAVAVESIALGKWHKHPVAKT
jgi:hypothetical protein